MFISPLLNKNQNFKLKISATIITFNEENNIARCIDSLLSVADEIVVVDSFSTDRTEEICRSKGVKFIQHKFEGHIEQKNFAITQASHPRILSLDADEALSPELASSILNAKQKWKFDGYEFNRLTNYCGKWIRHCGWYPDKKIRLWDRSAGQWGGINPHDAIKMKSGMSIGYLKGDLLHYSYTSIRQHIDQLNYFTEIMAKEAVTKGKNATMLNLFFSPGIKFFKSYLIQLGILDGYYGFIVCTLSSFATFIKYTKIIELKKRN